MRDLIAIAAEQKEQLLARESAQAAEIARAFGAAYVRIRAAAAQLEREAAEKYQGEAPPPEFFNERDRLQRVRAQLESALREFTGPAAAKIAEAQSEMIGRGVDDAGLLVRALTEEPGRGAAGAISSRLVGLVGKSGDGAPLAMLFERFAPAVARAVAEVLVEGIGAGVSPHVLASRIRERAGLALTRALLVARQETLRVYREAQLETYSTAPGVVAWRWLAALDVRTCLICWAMDGRTFPLSIEFSSHVSCRCSMVPLTVKSAPVKTGPERFEELEEGVKKEILGPARFELYRRGRTNLEQFVGVRHSAQWGLVRYERGARDLLREQS